MTPPRGGEHISAMVLARGSREHSTPPPSLKWTTYEATSPPSTSTRDTPPPRDAHFAEGPRWRKAWEDEVVSGETHNGALGNGDHTNPYPSTNIGEPGTPGGRDLAALGHHITLDNKACCFINRARCCELVVIAYELHGPP